MNNSWHSYPKVYNLGHSAVANLLLDDVDVEEKVDGSQFSFGRFDGELKCRSKGAQIVIDGPQKLFSGAVETIKTLDLHDGWTYRAEALQTPRHNTLKYDRVPKGHIILFDINTGEEAYMTYEEKRAEADRLGIECVPRIGRMHIDSVAALEALFENESVLGGCKIEGVVLKSHKRYGRDGKMLIGKYVSPSFREAHGTSWKAANPQKGDIVQAIIDTLRTDARFHKAVQHLRDDGKLEDSPTDIGALMREIHRDIDEECVNIIAEKLTQWALPKVKRGVASGFPEWYKQQLVEKQFAEAG